jgi:galactosyltransferase
MKLLIAIMTCTAHEANGDNQAIRDTWLRDVPSEVDCRFFCGQGPSAYPNGPKIVYESPLPKDVVTLSAKDDYESLVFKSREIHVWGLSCGYDFVFKTDRDVFVDVGSLLGSDFAQYDYSGFLHTKAGAVRDRIVEPYGFLGGSGYWTSQRACCAIANAEVDSSLGEDVWTGRVLGAAGFSPVSLPGYGDRITVHAPHPFGLYENSWMRNRWRKP